MKKFYKIIEGTEAYNMAHKVYHFKEEWNNPEFVKEFEQVIGVESNKNLILNNGILQLQTIPAGTESQFKKNKVKFQYGYAYEARVKSELNKKFLELVKKYDLKYYDMMHLVMMLGYGYWSTVHPFNEATSFVIESGNLREESFEHMEKLDCLEEISPTEFYKMKAEQAEAATA